MHFQPQGEVTSKWGQRWDGFHSGVDQVQGYGRAIVAHNPGRVYKIYQPGQREDNWSAVYVLSDMGGGKYMEICYGHLSKVFVAQGKQVKPGDIIGLEGNFGRVYSGNMQITPEMQDAGDKRGSHLHESWRPVRLVTTRKKEKHYLLRTDNTPYVLNGQSFEILNYDNKTKGTIDPYLYRPSAPFVGDSTIHRIRDLKQRLATLLNKKSEIDYLARTLWGEARGEKEAGREAVAHVILNRTRSKRFPSTVKGVVTQPWQFSCWNVNDPNRTKLLSANDAAFRECLVVAEAVFLGKRPDSTGGADHYFNPAIVLPSWAQSMTKTKTIGNHVFYKS